MTRSRPPEGRGRRWRYAVAAFGLGILYTGLLAALGIEVRAGGRDVALPVAGATELAFAAFGFLLGRGAEVRAAERRLSEEHERSLDRLAALQSRLARSERLAVLGQLAGSVAHEVRNPLAIVRSAVQNLAEGATSGPGEPRRTCDLVIEEIDRVSSVTAGLLGLARPLAPRLERLDAVELLHRVEWLALRLLEGRPVSLRVTPTPAVFRSDADLVCQVLLGLVANAAEASPQGAAIEIACEPRGPEVEFRVRDEGPGVPSELRERVFDPFFTTRPAGAGLGLAVARRTAEALGGRLALVDVAGGGACFALALPSP
jgi:two-component system sensor histidine kinase HydH